jgi:hypothetical protein
VVDAQALERALELGPGIAGLSFAGLGGEEELARRPFQPGPDPEFGVAVCGGHVDVVDPGADDDVEDPVRFGLGGGRQPGRPEQDPGALVARAPKGCFLYAHFYLP